MFPNFTKCVTQNVKCLKRRYALKKESRDVAGLFFLRTGSPYLVEDYSSSLAASS